MKKRLVAALVALVGSAGLTYAETNDNLSMAETGDPASTPAVETDSLISPITITTITISSNWLTWYLPTWKCQKWDHSAASSTDLGNTWYRQILVLSTGYQDADRAAFWTDFSTIIDKMSHSGNVWSTVKRNQIIWCGYFTGGGAIGAADATFGAAVLPHPIRDFALSLSNTAVYQKESEIKSSSIPNLRPMGALVIFNDFQSNITANAAPPSFVNKSFGVAKMNREDLGNGYIATHELGHGALNFLDEYVEGGLENLNIRSFDVATPLILFDGTWSGFWTAFSDLIGNYDYNISEILASNGNENIALSSVPSTVSSPISSPVHFQYEGGFFFGRGTWHMRGSNLMNGNHVMRASDDGFAYDHSADQWSLINNAFGSNAARANDELRNAGPMNGWLLEFGSQTTVMMFDGDKRSHFHPTKKYVVEVAWQERVWGWEWWGPFPYYTYHDEWRYAQNTVYPKNRSIDLKTTSLYGLANLAQSVLCGVGVTEIPKPDGGMFELCDQPLSNVASAFLPTFTFWTPYELTKVPASQWMTTYWWHFRSYNGTAWSGYTGWSSFYRSL